MYPSSFNKPPQRFLCAAVMELSTRSHADGGASNNCGLWRLQLWGVPVDSKVFCFVFDVLRDGVSWCNPGPSVTRATLATRTSEFFPAAAGVVECALANTALGLDVNRLLGGVLCTHAARSIAKERATGTEPVRRWPSVVGRPRFAGTSCRFRFLLQSCPRSLWGCRESLWCFQPCIVSC